MPGMAKGVDWSSIFVHELEVKGTYIYDHAESYQGKTWKTFDLAIELMAQGGVDLGWMVTHKFELDDYKRALKMMGSRGENQVIKAVFELEDGKNAE
jgi:threonine dehydrogenase-like Zn-dependent dehydrogenase